MARFVFTRPAGPRFTFTKTAVGAAGPNVITDSTAIGSLTEEASPLWVIGTNAAGTFTRKVDPASFGGGGGGAPTNASYVTLATNATLTSERVLTAGTGITITDGGAGSTVTVATTAVLGPGSSTDEAVARFDSTTGKLIQQSGQVYISDAGQVTQYPAGVTSGTAATDAAYAAVVPNGTTVVPRVLRSLRPESLPDWRETITVSANPSGTVPDVVHSVGWNVAAGSAFSDSTKPGVWAASECWWNPAGTYRVIEHHQIEGGWPSGSGVSARWWNGARRALTSEMFDAGGFGGYGVPVTVGMDTDVLALRSNCPDQAAYGGEARNVGSDHFSLRHYVATGQTELAVKSTNAANTHAFYIEANKGGYSSLYGDRRVYLQSLISELYLGAGAVFMGPFTPSSTADGSAASGTVYYSTTGSRPAFKDGGGTANYLAYTTDTLPVAQLAAGAAGKGPRSNGTAVSNTFPAGDLTATNSGAFNMATSQRHVRTLDGTNGTLSLSNDADGMSMTLCLKQDATGGRTVTWFSGITTWFGTASPSTPPTLSTAAGKRDYVTVIRHASGDYDAFFAKGS